MSGCEQAQYCLGVCTCSTQLSDTGLRSKVETLHQFLSLFGDRDLNLTIAVLFTSGSSHLSPGNPDLSESLLFCPNPF